MARRIPSNNLDLFSPLNPDCNRPHQPEYMVNITWQVAQELLDGTRVYEARRKFIDEQKIRAYLFTGGNWAHIEGYVGFGDPKKVSIDDALRLFGNEQESVRSFLVGAKEVYVSKVLERFAFKPAIPLQELIKISPDFIPPEKYQTLHLTGPKYEPIRNFLVYRPGKNNPPRGGCGA